MNISTFRNENAPEMENIPALKAGDVVNVQSVEKRATANYGDMLVLVMVDGSKRRTFSASLIKSFTVAGHVPFDMLAQGETVEGTIVEKTSITKNGKQQKTRPFMTIE